MAEPRLTDTQALLLKVLRNRFERPIVGYGPDDGLPAAPDVEDISMAKSLQVAWAEIEHLRSENERLTRDLDYAHTQTRPTAELCLEVLEVLNQMQENLESSARYQAQASKATVPLHEATRATIASLARAAKRISDLDGWTGQENLTPRAVLESMVTEARARAEKAEAVAQLNDFTCGIFADGADTIISMCAKRVDIDGTTSAVNAVAALCEERDRLRAALEAAVPLLDYGPSCGDDPSCRCAACIGARCLAALGKERA